MTKPEPKWWAEARRLRADGWKIEAIVAQLGKARSTVQCALNPRHRERQNALNRRWWREQDADSRARRNQRKRLAYARQQRKKWEEREKVLDTSGGGAKLAHDERHHAPLYIPTEKP